MLEGRSPSKLSSLRERADATAHLSEIKYWKRGSGFGFQLPLL